MSRFPLLLAIVVSVTHVSASAPSQLAHYRNVALGDATLAVVEQLKLRSTDVKMLYEHPSLVQELTWRPAQFVPSGAVADPLAELLLTFHRDRLVRIVATYDRDRTRGLTDSDLLELLSDVYGVPELQTMDRRSPATLLSVRQVVGNWSDDHARVILWRETYPSLVGLTITGSSGSAAEIAVQHAIVEGARLAAEEAPARERDRQAADAAAMKARDARIRVENKANFKP